MEAGEHAAMRPYQSDNYQTQRQTMDYTGQAAGDGSRAPPAMQEDRQAVGISTQVNIPPD